MSGPEVYSLGQTRITSHSFNADRSRQYYLSYIRLPHRLTSNIRGGGQLELERCSNFQPSGP